MNDIAPYAALSRPADDPAVDHAAFLLGLEDQLRPLSDPFAITCCAARNLSVKLDVDRACYGVVDEAAGTYRIPGGCAERKLPGMVDAMIRLEDFGAMLDAMRSGQPLVSGDAQGDRRFETARGGAALKASGVAALLDVPLVKDGRLVAVLSINHSAIRPWLPSEVRLVEAVAQRTWAAVERAYAEQRLRQAQSIIERQNEELRQASRRKDEFLAVLAHELRNPLAPIRNALQILRQSDEPAIAEQAQAMMGRQVGHMVRLIDDLLDVSRITTGKLRLARADVKVAAVIEQAVETARPQIDNRGQRLAIDSRAGDVVVNGDSVRLAQIVLNLLNNASKYSAPGSTITVRSAADAGLVEIEVQDAGIGLAPESLSSVFELFAQVEQGRDASQGGLGIGLAIARHLAEMHRGRLTARSDGLGHGATFSLQLPAFVQRRPARDNTLDPHTGAGARRRVVVADDNRDAADSLSLTLRLNGFDVATGYDGPAAITLIRTRRPDVAIVDLGMPGCDGLEVARTIRADPHTSGTLLIALTGWGQDDDKRCTREAGFNRHFVKPAEPVEVMAGMQELLGY